MTLPVRPIDPETGRPHTCDGRYLPTRADAVFRRQVREQWIARWIETQLMSSLHELKILDVGCGEGDWLVQWIVLGAVPGQLFGIDTDEARIGRCQARLPTVSTEVGDARALPWEDASFDIVTQSTVFTSVLAADDQAAIAREMIRVCKPDGWMLWYDFQYDNPWNPNVRKVTARRLKELFPGYKIRWERMTLAPPLARFIAKRHWLSAHVLESLRLLNTHIMAVISR